MKFTKDIEKHIDDRGFFCELPIVEGVKQYSISKSKCGVLRGLHYQYHEPMGKQIVVLSGRIIECIVDLRRETPTFGNKYIFECDRDNNSCFYVPVGYAHGFLSVEDNTELLYFQTARYNPRGEGSINPFDETLNINWGIQKEHCLLSERDSNAESFLSFSNKKIEW